MYGFLIILLFLPEMTHGNMGYQDKFGVEDAGISCLDDFGNRVDGFVVNKFRKTSRSDVDKMSEGLRYGYLLAGKEHQYTNGRWNLSIYRINQQESMITRTISQWKYLSVSSAAYNDDPPPGKRPASEDVAHAKGFIMLDEISQSAVWISHSIPKLNPYIEDFYPTPALKLGQHFVCISLPVKGYNEVVNHLSNMKTYVHDNRRSRVLLKNLNLSIDALEEPDVQLSSFVRFDSKTMAGENFILLSQGRKNFQDLWSSIVSLSLESNLVVQSFRCSPSKPLPDTKVGHYKTLNVNVLNLLMVDENQNKLSKEEYKSGSDHSKWAITITDNLYYVCIGDLNRVEKQKERGGGAVCFNNKIWHNVYMNHVGWEKDETDENQIPSNDMDCCEEINGLAPTDMPLTFPSEDDGIAHEIDYVKEYLHSSSDISKDVTFFLYTNDYQNSPMQILVDDERNAGLKNLPTKLIIHGFWGSAFNDWVIDMKYAYVLGSKDINVIAVHWHSLAAQLIYNIARANTRQVGSYVAQLIKSLIVLFGIQADNIHCIGHSLGAHVCGYAGKQLAKDSEFQLQRITAMDPARPLFYENKPHDRLSKNDAHYVDVIHTCAKFLGISYSLGHLDFYPNDGYNQVGCFWDVLGICKHSRSYKLFIESIRNPMSLLARKCSSWDNFRNGACTDSTITYLGETADFKVYGDYFLTTSGSSPYGRSYHGTNLRLSQAEDSQKQCLNENKKKQNLKYELKEIQLQECLKNISNIDEELKNKYFNWKNFNEKLIEYMEKGKNQDLKIEEIQKENQNLLTENKGFENKNAELIYENKYLSAQIESMKKLNETNAELKTSLQETKAEIEKLKETNSELKHKEKENSKCDLKDKQIQECQLTVELLKENIEKGSSYWLDIIEKKNDALTLCNEISSALVIQLHSLTEKNQNIESEYLRLSNNLKNISEELKILKSGVSTKNSKSQTELSDKLKLEIRETYRKNKNLTDNDKRIMVSACQSGETSVVTANLDLGFNIDTILHYDSCLQVAANYNRVNLAKELLERGANLEIRDTFHNMTPLISAAARGHLDMVKLFVERGANLSARSFSKKTALGFAKRFKYQDMINYLLSKGAPE